MENFSKVKKIEIDTPRRAKTGHGGIVPSVFKFLVPLIFLDHCLSWDLVSSALPWVTYFKE